MKLFKYFSSAWYWYQLETLHIIYDLIGNFEYNMKNCPIRFYLLYGLLITNLNMKNFCCIINE